MNGPTSGPTLYVEAPGPLTTVQDHGRPGYAGVGVGRSGAADRRSHDLANRLVGNHCRAATLECTLGGLALRVSADVLVAVTGAPGPVELAGRPEAMNAPLTWLAGTVLRLPPPVRGLRRYLAVRCGVGVPPVLGSRSTDTLSGIGPPPLAAGDTVAVGRDTGAVPLVDLAPVPDLPGEPVLRVQPGPRLDRFDARAWPTLLAASWTVSPDSNRIGVRLVGSAAVPEVDGDPPSAPLVPGAVQVPAGGRPIVFLADHPVTGGYPVLAVVRTADLGLAAQLRPGDRVRFTAR